MEKFCIDIAATVDSSDDLPITVVAYIDKAIQAKFHLAQEKEEKMKFIKGKKRRKPRINRI